MQRTCILYIKFYSKNSAYIFQFSSETLGKCFPNIKHTSCVNMYVCLQTYTYILYTQYKTFNKHVGWRILDKRLFNRDEAIVVHKHTHTHALPVVPKTRTYMKSYVMSLRINLLVNIEFKSMRCCCELCV